VAWSNDAVRLVLACSVLAGSNIAFPLDAIDAPVPADAPATDANPGAPVVTVTSNVVDTALIGQPTQITMTVTGTPAATVFYRATANGGAFGMGTDTGTFMLDGDGHAQVLLAWTPNSVMFANV